MSLDPIAHAIVEDAKAWIDSDPSMLDGTARDVIDSILGDARVEAERELAAWMDERRRERREPEPDDA